MLFQLTSAGRALIASNPTGTYVTRAEFGGGFNYVPDNEPTGLRASVVYTANAVFQPTIDTPNTLRYSVFIPGPIGPFTFGEVALYVGSTLLGIGAQVTQITKTVGSVDNQYRLDVFIDLENGAHFASFEVVSSDTRHFFPRVSSVDTLVAPAYDTNNAYVVYGTSQPGEGFLAYSDPSGIWSFSSKPHLWFTGTVKTIGDQGLQSDDLLGATYNGQYTDLVLQFLTGELRGYCRKVTNITTAGGVLWNTLLLDYQKVSANDQFIIVGPAAAVGFAGTHNSLGGLQGGDTNEYYHLTGALYDNVRYPRLKLKSISAATYNVAADDDDTMVTLTNPTVTVNVSNPSQTTYPIGGLTVFRVINSIVTFQASGSGITLAPTNPVTIDCTGKTVTFAYVRKSATAWDLVAPAAASQGSGSGGNVYHTYSGSTTRSNHNAVVKYSDVGSETGPNANLEQTRLVLMDQSVRLSPLAQDATAVWSVPAALTWPLALGTIGTSSTGLANTSSTYALGFTLNSVAYTLNIMGSAAQTFASMVSALNAAATSALPNGVTLVFSLAGDQLVMLAGSGSATTTLTLTTTTLLTASTGLQPPMLTITSDSAGVGVNALMLDSFSTNHAFLRSVDSTAKAVGFRSRVKGLVSSVFGGRWTSVEGDLSTSVGANGGFLHALRSVFLGGSHNSISKTSTGTISDSVVIGGQTNTLTNDGANNAELSTVISSKKVTSVGNRNFVAGTDTATVPTDSVVLTGQNIAVPGANSTVINGRTVYSSGAPSNNTLIGVNTINVSTKNTVVLHQHDLNITQSGALYFPTDSNIAGKGQVGSVFTAHTSAYGSGSALRLTTDSQGATANNGMQVINGQGWMFRGTVSANKGSADFKGWNVSGHLCNILGTVTIVGLNFEVVGETSGAVGWELDMVVDTTNTDRVFFTINTAGPVTGLDTVAVSAFITINSSRPLL